MSTATREAVKIPIGDSAWYDTAKHSIKSVARGLEELITNSATSYFRAGLPARILISLDERNRDGCVLSVRDEAAGMTARELETKLKIGSDAGERDGDAGRGFFKRGLKDLMTHGKVDITTLKSGRFSHVELFLEGVTPKRSSISTYRADSDSVKRIFGKNDVESGTLVIWRPTASKRFINRTYNNLREDILRLSAIWRLLADWDECGHDIRLIHGGAKKPERLKLPLPRGRLVRDEILATSRATAPATRLRLYWNSERDEVHSGIIVCGADAVYDFPFLTEAAKRDRDREFLFGILECPALDHVRNEDASELIDPQRLEGLDRDHPFVRDLLREVNDHVLACLNENRSKSPAANTPDEINRRLRDIGRLFSRRLQEIEGPDGPGPEKEFPSFCVLPPRAVVPPEESCVLHCYVRSGQPPKVSTLVDDNTITVEVGEPRQWDKHQGYWSVPMVVLAGSTEGEFTFVAFCDEVDGAETIVAVAVREQTEPLPVNRLQFDQENYTIRLRGTRKLRLRAPFGDGGWLGESPIVITHDSQSTPIINSPSEFRLDLLTGDLVSLVEVAGRQVAERRVRLEASQDEQSTHCFVQVTEGKSGGRIPFTYDLSDVDDTDTRAKWAAATVDHPNHLIIHTQHAALRIHLPDKSADSKKDPKFLAVVAEIIVQYGAMKLAEARCKRDGLATVEPQAFMSRYEQEAERIAAQVQRILQGP